jgi:hypothetical protein
MGFTNLPGIFEEKQDGNLTILPVNSNPIVLVVGTASKGFSDSLYRVDRIADAAREFGKDGTLIRGMYEASVGGALNLRLLRVGGKSAVLDTKFGLTIETVFKDDTAGTSYIFAWDDTLLRLRVWRVEDDELVFDNNPAYPGDRVDLAEVSVTGTAETAGSDYGAEPGQVGTKTLADMALVSGFTYTAGSDGLELSRMETYEALYNAYQSLADQELDVIIPMNVYLDDLNVMDMNAASVTSRGLTALTDYPSAGTEKDVLGKVYVEEFEGRNFFWWWFPAQPASATPSFVGGAQIAPSEGLADATHTIDGTVLTAGDFAEVNFAHQLAMFCYKQGVDNGDVSGTIGVLPPNSFTMRDVARWVGELPQTETDANGKVIIASGGNGLGLLGNKFMSGRRASGGGTGIAGFAIDGVDGLFNGGFIATDDGFVSGLQLKDHNEHLIDVGKYLSIVATYPVLSNPSRASAYTATGAADYAGFYSVLPANSAPTNKLLGNLRLPFRINSAKLDLLAGQRYVTFHQKPRGIVVSDAPTAARPDSDYQRLSTVRQVKVTVDAIRDAAEPFLGEGMTGAMTAALDTAIDRSLGRLVKSGVINRYEFQTIITPQMRVLGQATVELKLVPAFELRQITVVVALAAV